MPRPACKSGTPYQFCLGEEKAEKSNLIFAKESVKMTDCAYVLFYLQYLRGLSMMLTEKAHLVKMSLFKMHQGFD